MIPVLLLTGFLGSGKTTLLNHLLGLPELAGKKITLIINEFGRLNIDTHLVREGDYRKYEINKGSIFCVCTKTAFIAAAREIALDPPDWVIIEATGIAETADIENFIHEALPDSPLQVRACLGLIDGTNFITLAATMKTARRQVMAADGLIFNKTDLVEPASLEQVRQVAAQLNPRAARLETRYARIPWDFIESLVHQAPVQPMCGCRDDTIYTMTLETDHPITRPRLEHWLHARQNELLRLKGNVRLNDGASFVELAAGRTTYKPPVESLGRQTRLSLIAWNIEKEIIQSEFDGLYAVNT